MNTYKIADLIVEFRAPSDCIHSFFQDFSYVTKNLIPDMVWLLEKELYLETIPKTPIIDTELLKVYLLDNDDIMLYYPSDAYINRCVLRNNLTEATVYYKNDIPKTSSTLESFSWNIYLAFRDAFFCFMQKKGLIAVHSASIIYNGKGYIFSASSGVGKSTHTGLWRKNYNTDILDGDVAACKIEDGKAVVFGLPWCGTSKLYKNQKLPLGGIIFLQQSCHNAIYPLNAFESILRLSARCFTPTWTEKLVDKNMQIAEAIIEVTPCALLNCLPNDHAVEVTKQYIDAQTSN